MKTVIDYILNMLPYMALALPVILAGRAAARRRLRRLGMETTTAHEIGTVLLFLFLVGLASQTVIPRLELNDGRIGVVQERVSGDINLELGRVFRDTRWEVTVNNNRAYLLINFVGNICMFIPIGFGLPLLWRRQPFYVTTLAGLAVSASIELLQLPLARGTDVDDLWINTLGAVLGWLLYALFARCFAHAARQCKVIRPEEDVI